MDQTEEIVEILIVEEWMVNISKPITECEAINECERIGVNFIGIKNVNKRNYIEFECKIHKDKGVQIASVYEFKKKKAPCNYCSNRRKDNTDFINEIKIRNSTIQVLDEYKNLKQTIRCKCIVCGNEWSTVSRNILRFPNCPICRIDVRANKRKYTRDQFVKILNEKQPDVELVSEYTKMHSMCLFKCKKCSNEWNSLPTNIVSGYSSCPSCRTNSNEKKIIKFLEDKGFSVMSQYRFADCKNIKPLPFDMYLPNENILIEYDGEQHYYPISFTGDKQDKYEAFEKRKVNDNIKTEYCKSKNINLIRIPYWERNNIEQFLFEKFSQIGIVF